MIEVNEPEQASEAIARAFHIAESGTQGPVAARSEGTASALLTATRQCGSALGVAILSATLVAVHGTTDHRTAVAIFVAAGLLRGTASSQGQLAETAVAALEHIPGEHHVFCADFAWCGFMVGAPHIQVFLDGRADPYPPRVWNDFVAIVRLHVGWRERLRARSVDAVIVARDAPLDQALAAIAGWRSAYADRRYRLWLRSGLLSSRPGRTRTAAKTVS